MFDFREMGIKSESLHTPWQTGGTSHLTRLAFNLWNGWTEDGKEQLSTPYELFACGLAPYFFTSAQPVQAQATSDRLRMGCIGVGDMGRGDAHGFNGLVDIVAVCDVDSLHLEMAQNDGNIGKKGADGKKIIPDGYKDYRKIPQCCRGCP